VSLWYVCEACGAAFPTESVWMHIGCGGEGNLPRYATAREGQVIELVWKYGRRHHRGDDERRR
jgi:hypothetical protein